MPSQIPDLFDALQEAAQAPLDLELKRQKVQDNAMILQLKMQGIQQQKLENEAGKLYDPADPNSLDRVAQYLFKGGDAKGALNLLKEKEVINKDREEAKWKAVETQGKV